MEPARQHLLPSEPDGGELLDGKQLREWTSYALGSLRRHWLLASAAAAVVLAAAALSLVALPRTWHVEVLMLASRNEVLTSLSNPRRSVPRDAEAPTRSAQETVLAHDNLLQLVEQTRLQQRWEQTRPPLLKLKDWVADRVVGPPTAQKKLDALLGLLEKRISVLADESTVRIGVDWPDGPTAYHLVEAAQENFLESRRAQEISPIVESISILESHANEARKRVLAALEAARKSQPLAVALKPRAAGGVSASPNVDQLRVELLAKRKAIDDLEQARSARRKQLELQLEEQRGVYHPDHPAMVDLSARIAALTEGSPETASLRRAEAALHDDYRRLGGDERELEAATGALVPLGPMPAVPEREAPEATALHQRLLLTVAYYEELVSRLDSARIELDSARAAFDQRYRVVRGAKLPDQPAKPTAPMVLGGAAAAALLLALVVALSVDLRRRRVEASWQLERQHRLRVLEEVDLP